MTQVNETKSGKRTLLTSLLFSAAGPLFLGIGAVMGRSSTSISNLINKSVELMANIVSFVIYGKVHNDSDGSVDEVKKKQLEKTANRIVGAVMIVSAVVLIATAIFTSTTIGGNMIVTILFSLQGVAMNCAFWRKYKKLSEQNNDAILNAQSKLYRGKTLVDLCVLIAMLFAAIAPTSPITAIVDKAGSIIVSLYLAYSGLGLLKTI